MSLVIEILSIVLIYFSGVFLGRFIPVPSSLISMALFFILLATGLLNHRHYQRISSVILSNLAFFFIPPAVEILDSMAVLKGYYLKLAIVMIVSNICVLAVTALVVQYVLKKKESENA